MLSYSSWNILWEKTYFDYFLRSQTGFKKKKNQDKLNWFTARFITALSTILLFTNIWNSFNSDQSTHALPTCIDMTIGLHVCMRHALFSLGMVVVYSVFPFCFIQMPYWRVLFQCLHSLFTYSKNFFFTPFDCIYKLLYKNFFWSFI